MGIAEKLFYSITTSTTCLLLLLMLQRGSGLSCWECNSKYDPNCGEPFKNHTIMLTDCNQRYLKHYPEVSGALCRKIIQKVRGERRIIRTCGYLEDKDRTEECFSRAGTHEVFMQYCHCKGSNGCNSAESVRATSAFAVASSILALLALLTTDATIW